MAENSAIEWTDHTFNPWEGCQKVSPGCDHCYAEVRNARYGGGAAPNWGPGAPRRRTSAANWAKPRRWAREAEAFAAEHGRRQRVFCASLADVFDNAVDPAWRADLFELIRATPELDWMLLTKRIGNAAAMLPADWGDGWPHAWLGATIVNQAEADRDVPKLLNTPAAVRFISGEPLLGPVDLEPWLSWPADAPDVGDKPWGCQLCDDGEGVAAPRCEQEGRCPASKAVHVTHEGPVDDKGIPSYVHDERITLDWVITGGESGPGARVWPGFEDACRSLRDQCRAAGVAFFMKQMAGPNKAAMPAIPDDLQVRQWPEVKA